MSNGRNVPDAGRVRAAGLREIDAAKHDDRWQDP